MANPSASPDLPRIFSLSSRSLAPQAYTATTDDKLPDRVRPPPLGERSGRSRRSVLEAARGASWGLHHVVLEGEGDRLELGVDAELDQDVLHVGADRVERQEALLGDAPVGPAGGQVAEDLALARAQGADQQLDARVAGRARRQRGDRAVVAADHLADRSGDLGARDVLGEEAVRAGLD